MTISLVTRWIAFDALNVEVSAWRYVCDRCNKVETFHNIPPSPYGEKIPDAQAKGWRLTYPDEGEQEAFCKGCPPLEQAVS